MSVRKWWCAVQPKWRNVVDSWPLPRDDVESGANWELVSHGGWNGVFLVILAVAWLISGLGGKFNKDVTELVLDITWVLDHTVESLKGDDDAGVRPGHLVRALKRKAEVPSASTFGTDAKKAKTKHRS